MLVPPANFGIAEEGIYRCSKVETLNLSFLETLDLKTVVYIGGQEPSKFFREFFNRSSIEWISIRIADYANVGAHVNSLKKSETTSDQEDSKQDDTDKNNNEKDGNGNASQSNSTERRLASEKDIFHQDESTDTTKDNDEIINSNKNKHLKYTLNDSDELMLIKSYCLKKTFRLLLDHKFYNVLLVDKTALIIGILRKIQKWNISSIINEYRLYAGKNRSYFAETFLELIELRIEQDKLETVATDKKETLMIEPDKSANETQRKLSQNNLIYVTEDDLCKPPKIPSRLIAIVEETERRENRDINKSDDEFDEDSLRGYNIKRSTSDMGIFGHRYRLTFNKKENGDYDYYKTENAQSTGSDYIKVSIPNELELPEWFKFQRDSWEQDNAPDVHHFYKEEIFV